MFLTLAYKNLWRNLRRTMLVEISVIFGVLVIVCTGNFLYGMQRYWAMFEIGANTGAFQIEHKDYKEMGKSEPLKTTLENGTALVDKVAKIPGVSEAFGKLKFTGMVSSGLKSTFFDGIAVDVKRQKQTLTMQENLIVGGKPLGESPGGVVLGADLAESLGINIGDPVSIVVQTYHGGLNLTYGTLVGKKNGRHFPSSTYLEMRLDEAQKLLRVNDRISQLVVGVKDFDEIPAVMQKATAGLGGEKTSFIARDYPELIPIYSRAMASFKFVSKIVGFVLFIMVGGGIGNMMAMAVMERKREIGTMRAMGMEKNQVRRLFLAEGLIVGGIGAVAGLVIASALTLFVASYGGVHLPPAPGTNEDLVIIPMMDPLMGVFGVIMPFIVGLFAAWWPASTSANMNPVQALTEV